MKYYILTFLLFPILCLAQAKILEAPEDLQLYPRNEQNKADVFVKGKKTDASFSTILLEVFEENMLIYSSSQNTEDFDFKVSIEAKPVEYKFVLTAIGSKNVKILEKSGIVCGDVFLLYGQSNMAATTGMHIAEQTIDTRLLRNYDFVDVYKREDTKFYKSLQPYAATGMIGIEIQRLLLANEGVPSLVINASVGGASLDYLKKGSVSFDELLKRVKGAKVEGKIKAVVWRQGETEICNWAPAIKEYPEKFNELYHQLDTEVGPFEKFYNIQLPLITCNKLEEAGFLRDFMRKTQYIYPKVRVLNALGLSQIDNLHHGYEAYIQTANELYAMMNFDLYKKGTFEDSFPPEIKNISLDKSKKQIELEFDQNVVFPGIAHNQGTDWDLKNYFYINTETYSNNYIVENAWTEKNKVFLQLKSPIDGGFVTYLPSFTNSEPPFHGVYLLGNNGLRANAFYKVAINKVEIKPILEKLSQTVIDPYEKDKLIVSGKNLDKVYSLSLVSNNVVLYSRIVDKSSSKIEFELPKPIKPGVYSVVYNYSESSALKIQVDFEPKIEEVAVQGARVQIKGYGFGDSVGALFIDNKNQNIIFWSDTFIEVLLNENLAEDWHKITIYEEEGGQASANEYFGVNLVLSSKENEIPLIYPVPFDGNNIFIKNVKEELKELYLFDQLGNTKKLSIKNLNHDVYEVQNLDFLKAGVYYLKLVTEKNIYFQKIVRL